MIFGTLLNRVTEPTINTFDKFCNHQKRKEIVKLALTIAKV